jgi:8-hydroxy-5-deazaflavin:NADPH oxidoreductase
MKVTIIGSGNVGSALGGTFARAGHDVTLAARDGARARAVAQQIGATAATSPAEAARDADVVVLAVPFAALDEVAEELREAAANKVVVDVTNPLTADYSGLATEGGPSAAEQLAEHLPDAKVVKAFNTVFGAVQANPTAHGQPADVLLATDDEAARATVAELASTSGFRPVAAGPLNAARQMEALAWLNMRIQMQSQGNWQAAVVILGAPPAAIAA